MDDFLIYSDTEEEHTQILLEVLQRLKENNLAIASDKCVWHTSRVEFLGHITYPQMELRWHWIRLGLS